MMPDHRKITISAFIIAFIIAALALCGQVYDGFSLTIKTKGRIACKNIAPCVFSLGDVFPGNWDRVLVFDVKADQEEIDQAVSHHLDKPHFQRLIVFMHGSNVVHTLTEPEGVEHTIPATVLFDRVPQTHNHQIVQHDWNFVMVKGAPNCEGCTTLSRIIPGEVVE